MAAINEVIDLSPEGDIAVVTVNSPPVNALSAKVREGLHKGYWQYARSNRTPCVASLSMFGERASPSP